MKKLTIQSTASLFFVLMMLFVTAPSSAQDEGNWIVSGQVVAETDGEPLPGVNIAVKGTERGTSTNTEGEYSIEVSSSDAVLIFSFVGFETQEVSVNGRETVDVEMQTSTLAGEEVVVVGYGSMEEEDLTGSVSSVSAADIDNTSSANFSQSLQGRVAGVKVTQTTGAPGGKTSIRIRGTTSINASSEPLYVIDGMIVNNNTEEMSIGGRGPANDPLSTLNPGDIESIEILKDASATAIYGSRGANGVVLITTKGGEAGRNTVSYEGSVGFQQVTKKLDLLNATEFGRLVNAAETNAGRNPVYVNPENLGTGTDWQEALFQVAPVSNHQLSFSGGDKNMQYAISGGYFTQEGIVIGSDFEKYSFRANFNRDINENLTVGNHLSYNRSNSSGVLTGPGTIVPGVITNAVQMNPILPVYNSEVEGGYTYEHDRKDPVANPVAEAKEYESITNTTRIVGDVFVEYSILENLHFKTSFGIDRLTTKSNSFGPNFLKRTENSNGEAEIQTLDALTWLNENTLTFDQDFGENHHVNALVGFTMQQFSNESLSAVAFDFPDGRTGWHDLGAAQNPQNPGNSERAWSMLSYIGRVNYSLHDKYLFTLTGRVDGSSKFAEGNKYGVFPSGAVAWRVTEEPFMQDVDFISNLKIRASYGKIGNQSIAPYQSLPLITPFGEGVFNDGNESEPFYGREPSSYPNQNLKWETTEQASFGIDLSVLDDRIDLTAEVYNKDTRDLLLNTPIPFTTGFQNTLLNIGNIQNRGFDLSINSTNVNGKDFSWNSSVNFSINRNEVKDLARDDDINLLGHNILREGEPIGSFYGYVFDGIFQSDQEAASSPIIAGQQQPSAGDRKYKDLNDDGVVNEADRRIIGSAQPDFTYGISNSINYKNFSLSFFFQGSQGNELVNANLQNLENVNGAQNVMADAWHNRWRQDNPSDEYARPLANTTDNVFSTRFVEDASYIRLKSLSVGYNLPVSIGEKLSIRNMRVYLKGTNLWTLTDYSGYNPEADAYSESTAIVGVDNGNYPQAKTYTVGINIEF